MNYYLGIDGGGTKTAFLLMDETGRKLCERKAIGCSYKQHGIEGVLSMLKEEIKKCFQEAGIYKELVAQAVLGLPCYGENPPMDHIMEEKLKQLFGKIPLTITNDVKVGWAGSLALRPGINIVAGTGSIAYGQDSHGSEARAGGWSEYFSDEGSCGWLGRKTMELFGKQADYRVERGALYQIIRKEFNLTDDMDFVPIVEKDYIPYREKVASMQRFLLEAVRSGDVHAKELYKEAAEELYLIIKGVYEQLGFGEETVDVSYSGGLFYAGEFVLPRLEELIGQHKMVLKKPEFSPVEGAVLIAVSQMGTNYVEKMRHNMGK